MMVGGGPDLVKQIFLENHAFGVFAFFTLVLVTLFFGWLVNRWTVFKFRSFPPGPIGFPIIGHIGVLLREPHEELFWLSKKYGKIFSLYFGTDYAVATTDYEIAKEIVSHPATLSRPKEVFGFVPGGGGFAGASGPEWQEQRRFCVTIMRNLRVGRGIWESMIKDHVVDFIEELSSWRGKPTDPGELVTLSVASNNVALFIGRRLSKKSNPETVALIEKAAHVLVEHFSTSGLSVIMPWLTKCLLLLRIGEYQQHARILDEFANFFREEVKRHMNSKDLDDENLIDSYLKEMEKQNATKRHHYFSVDNLVAHLIVLFFASSDTTGSSLHWLLLLMAAYPEVQKKVQQEVDDVIGRNRQTAWDERKQLPYTMAAILEMERFVTVNRLFPPRISTETFECAGYTIPKGSRILVNSWAIMHDPNYWDNPMEFIPERFIRSDGKDPSKTEGVSTFSFGRRSCPGEVVALMTIFLFFTAVMQKFTIKPPSGCTADLTEGPSQAVVSPVKQKLRFVPRD